MPVFGRRSQAYREQLHPELIEVVDQAIIEIDFSIVEAHRDENMQNAFFAQGRTTPGKIITKVQWPDGSHNKVPSDAMHLLPWPFDPKRDWLNFRHFDHLAGMIRGVAGMLGVPLTWGGDWDGDHDLHDQSFNDLLHYQRASAAPRTGIPDTFS